MSIVEGKQITDTNGAHVDAWCNTEQLTLDNKVMK